MKDHYSDLKSNKLKCQRFYLRSELNCHKCALDVNVPEQVIIYLFFYKQSPHNLCFTHEKAKVIPDTARLVGGDTVDLDDTSNTKEEHSEFIHSY